VRLQEPPFLHLPSSQTSGLTAEFSRTEAATAPPIMASSRKAARPIFSIFDRRFCSALLCAGRRG
jgi:hypothetical protein